jgi:hypothetical protein
MDQDLLCSELSDILKYFRSLLENHTLDKLVSETELLSENSLK